MDNDTNKTRNPVLKRIKNKNITESYQKVATTERASLKSLLLLALVIASSVISCYYAFSNHKVYRIYAQYYCRTI